MIFPSPKTVPRGFIRCMIAALVVMHGMTAEIAAQGNDSEFRFGVTVGGIGLWGLALEYRVGDTGVDLNVGTFSFKDLSVSVAAKRYFGGGDLRPFLGLGLWGVAGQPEEDPRRGLALLAIAPIGLDWEPATDHYIGTSLNVNEGLWIRRSDPADDTAISRRPIPLPAIYYRYRR